VVPSACTHGHKTSEQELQRCVLASVIKWLDFLLRILPACRRGIKPRWSHLDFLLLITLAVRHAHLQLGLKSVLRFKLWHVYCALKSQSSSNRNLTVAGIVMQRLIDITIHELILK